MIEAFVWLFLLSSPAGAKSISDFDSKIERRTDSTLVRIYSVPAQFEELRKYGRDGKLVYARSRLGAVEIERSRKALVVREYRPKTVVKYTFRTFAEQLLLTRIHVMPARRFFRIANGLCGPGLDVLPEVFQSPLPVVQDSNCSTGAFSAALSSVEKQLNDPAVTSCLISEGVEEDPRGDAGLKASLRCDARSEVSFFHAHQTPSGALLGNDFLSANPKEAAKIFEHEALHGSVPRFRDLESDCGMAEAQANQALEDEVERVADKCVETPARLNDLSRDQSEIDRQLAAILRAKKSKAKVAFRLVSPSPVGGLTIADRRAVERMINTKMPEFRKTIEGFDKLSKLDWKKTPRQVLAKEVGKVQDECSKSLQQLFGPRCLEKIRLSADGAAQPGICPFRLGGAGFLMESLKPSGESEAGDEIKVAFPVLFDDAGAMPTLVEEGRPGEETGIARIAADSASSAPALTEALATKPAELQDQVRRMVPAEAGIHLTESLQSWVRDAKESAAALVPNFNPDHPSDYPILPNVERRMKLVMNDNPTENESGKASLSVWKLKPALAVNALAGIAVEKAQASERSAGAARVSNDEGSGAYLGGAASLSFPRAKAGKDRGSPSDGQKGGSRPASAGADDPVGTEQAKRSSDAPVVSEQNGPAPSSSAQGLGAAQVARIESRLNTFAARASSDEELISKIQEAEPELITNKVQVLFPRHRRAFGDQGARLKLFWNEKTKHFEPREG